MMELEALRNKARQVAQVAGSAALSHDEYVAAQWDQVEREIGVKLFELYPDIKPLVHVTRSGAAPGDYVHGTIAVVQDQHIHVIFRAYQLWKLQNNGIVIQWIPQHPWWLEVWVDRRMVHTTDNPYLAINQAFVWEERLAHAH